MNSDLDSDGIKIKPVVLAKDILEAQRTATYSTRIQRSELEPIIDGDVTVLITSDATAASYLDQTERRSKIEPESSSTAKKLLAPAFSSWFSFDAISEVEKRGFPEIFQRQDDDLHKRYQEIRDFMVKTYRSQPTQMLSLTSCRRFLGGDVAFLMKIHAFLDHWGLINYEPNIDSFGTKCEASVSYESGIRKSLLFRSASRTTTQGVAAQEGKLYLRNLFDLDSTEKKACCYCNHPICSYFQGLKKPIILCQKCFEDRRYDADAAECDFVFVSGREMESLNVWSEAEAIRLLEGIENYGSDWSRISQHVGSKSREDCLLQFLRLPIRDYLVENEFVSSILKEKADGESDPLLLSRIPFTQTSNPVMSTMAFLASLIHPNIAAAAAQAATQELQRIKETEEAANETNGKELNDRLQCLSGIALGAAAGKAKSHAEMEEKKLQRLLNVAIEAQIKKVEIKLQHFEELTQQVEKERNEFRMQRMQMLQERRQYQAQLLLQNERSRSATPIDEVGYSGVRKVDNTSSQVLQDGVYKSLN